MSWDKDAAVLGVEDGISEVKISADAALFAKAKRFLKFAEVSHNTAIKGNEFLESVLNFECTTELRRFSKGELPMMFGDLRVLCRNRIGTAGNTYQRLLEIYKQNGWVCDVCPCPDGGHSDSMTVEHIQPFDLLRSKVMCAVHLLGKRSYRINKEDRRVAQRFARLTFCHDGKHGKEEVVVYVPRRQFLGEVFNNPANLMFMCSTHNKRKLCHTEEFAQASALFPAGVAEDIRKNFLKHMSQEAVHEMRLEQVMQKVYTYCELYGGLDGTPLEAALSNFKYVPRSPDSESPSEPSPPSSARSSGSEGEAPPPSKPMCVYCGKTFQRTQGLGKHKLTCPQRPGSGAHTPEKQKATRTKQHSP